MPILLDSFRFAQEQRGLRIYGWVLMPNHFHAIVSCDAPFELSSVLRDMKKFTSSQIVKAISEYRQESRRCWLLPYHGRQGDETGREDFKALGGYA